MATADAGTVRLILPDDFELFYQQWGAVVSGQGETMTVNDAAHRPPRVCAPNMQQHWQRQS